MRQPLIRFRLCRCRLHGWFVGVGVKRKDLYARDEVDYYILLYLLVGRIDYKEIDRIFKVMDRVNFPRLPQPCALPKASSR